MLLSDKIQVRWNGSTRQYYIKKGYEYTKQGKSFECDIKDVQLSSTAKVSVKCDYCGEMFSKEYRRYLKGRTIIDKDCCINKKCGAMKTKETNLIRFGVESNNQRPDVKEKNSKSRRESFDVVRGKFQDKKLTLLSNEENYKNDRSRLKFICNQHKDKGIQETNYANIKKNKYCCFYGGSEQTGLKHMVDGNTVYNDFVKYGLIPMFRADEYERNNKPLPYLCPKHKEEGVQYRQYSNIKYAKNCKYCKAEILSEYNKLDKDYVFECFDKKGLIVLDNYYEGKDIHINFECKKHLGFNQKVSYQSLKVTKTPCKLCREELSLSRINRKVRSALSWWRKYSKNVSGNKCILTGLNKDLEIHHQYQLDNIIKESLLDLNIDFKEKYTGEEILLIKNKVNDMHKRHPIGVCLNKELHILFHIQYGKKDCSKTNMNDFINDYFDGKYDNKLDNELKSINSNTNYEEAVKIASFYYVKSK